MNVHLFLLDKKQNLCYNYIRKEKGLNKMNKIACPKCGSEIFCYGELKDYDFYCGRCTALWDCKCQDCDARFMLCEYYNHIDSEVKEC